MAAGAGTHLSPLPPPSNSRHLIAETQRLRQELIKAQLDVISTLAKFAAQPHINEKLRQLCNKTARDGYSRALKILRSEDRNPKALEHAEKQVRLALMSFTPVEVETPRRLESAGVAHPPTLSPHEIPTQPEHLTRRETEVLKCIAEGRSTKQLASMLGITFKTASCHREHIMGKLGTHSTAMLVRYAIRAGLVQP